MLPNILMAVLGGISLENSLTSVAQKRQVLAEKGLPQELSGHAMGCDSYACIGGRPRPGVLFMPRTLFERVRAMLAVAVGWSA